jgi:hypothetical protein
MGNLIPGAALIYERAEGVVYARYRDPPHNTLPRWIVGGDPVAVGKAQGELLPYSEWVNLCRLALENQTLKKQLDKTVEIYYLIKEEQ